ncbi:LacI family DNA-binding transcriptional regulator [Pokkaliibacter sp. MBI-7]|uniref:LacI family DNA-binding transcriptional regulator n=1 Tax=Pokkaliibacter sp. MBI-7 TaxID=3040600 RepID=UPI00244D5889|nr:LacI family DNA-binding transcriptional regulator [Pokkaliibacter sp. MBI-7]MDH2433059.1 LacI family DNA-binding transcriptional regulator [Pokkaliibacter sp. MBI-7]
MTSKMPREVQRKVTASDVAARAGVSKWTVSRAFVEGASISPDSLQRVKQAAEELGYRPNLLARSLSKKRTNIVGVVMDEFTNPNVLEVLDEVSRQLQRKGYSTMLLNINAQLNYKPALLLADQFQVDGVIFLGTSLPDELLHLIQDIRHIPLIVLYRNSTLPGIQVVNTDDFDGGEQLAGVLLQQGYQRMGYMAGPPSGSTQLERINGFSHRLAQAGLQVEQVLEAGSYLRQRGYETMTAYLQVTDEGQWLDALFCENDNLALGALDALRAAGCEGRIAVVGFDGTELGSSPSYNLTTYRQPFEQLTAEAIRQLEQAEPQAGRFLAKGELVIRSSHLKR